MVKLLTNYFDNSLAIIAAFRRANTVFLAHEPYVDKTPFLGGLRRLNGVSAATGVTGARVPPLKFLWVTSLRNCDVKDFFPVYMHFWIF